MENQTPAIPVSQPEPQPKQSNFLVILLSILLLVAVLIAGFFAYQTQKLVGELNTVKQEPTPTVTFEPTSEPVATESATVEPTKVPVSTESATPSTTATPDLIN